MIFAQQNFAVNRICICLTVCDSHITDLCENKLVMWDTRESHVKKEEFPISNYLWDILLPYMKTWQDHSGSCNMFLVVTFWICNNNKNKLTTTSIMKTNDPIKRCRIARRQGYWYRCSNNVTGIVLLVRFQD